MSQIRGTTSLQTPRQAVDGLDSIGPRRRNRNGSSQAGSAPAAIALHTDHVDRASDDSVSELSGTDTSTTSSSSSFRPLPRLGGRNYHDYTDIGTFAGTTIRPGPVPPCQTNPTRARKPNQRYADDAHRSTHDATQTPLWKRREINRLEAAWVDGCGQQSQRAQWQEALPGPCRSSNVGNTGPAKTRRRAAAETSKTASAKRNPASPVAPTIPGAAFRASEASFSYRRLRKMKNMDTLRPVESREKMSPLWGTSGFTVGDVHRYDPAGNLKSKEKVPADYSEPSVALIRFIKVQAADILDRRKKTLQLRQKCRDIDARDALIRARRRAARCETLARAFEVSKRERHGKSHSRHTAAAPPPGTEPHKTAKKTGARGAHEKHQQQQASLKDTRPDGHNRGDVLHQRAPELDPWTKSTVGKIRSMFSEMHEIIREMEGESTDDGEENEEDIREWENLLSDITW
eukprot:scpid73457/ scgid11261/ 